jgi:hypothetical protein
MEDFISLFSSIPCHLKYFETANEKIPKMHYFIMEFHKTNFYCFICCLWDEMKLIDINTSFVGFHFF